ncbi:MAG: MinD/ParA family protein [Oscillochloris sp.]|nr:MinD/ParA family protein [Oscillochloris sp.]
MATIISVHSFRGGTGKSNTTANLTLLLAVQGYRVGVIDTDIQSPGIHVIFGLNEDQIVFALNDYLWGDCEIEDAAYDLSAAIPNQSGGAIYLIPASIKPGEIARILRDGYDPGLLNEGLQRIVETLNLDVLLIDTHPGLNEETLLSLAISDAVLIILRPDQQDYQGTSVTVEVAKKLEVPRVLLLVNKVPESFDLHAVQQRVEEAYGCEIAAVIPHSDDLMTLASSAIFALRFPDHPVTQAYRQAAARLLA